ncbi:hypothetical protein R3P38DRAFT_3168465 [Favolaschia claudopus]|uniref:Uncharacterized protein n=1 Tax=Favolaschia claudopus TaxID=2862362 RepID=A0AAW0EAP1_9AGAR
MSLLTFPSPARKNQEQSLPPYHGHSAEAVHYRIKPGTRCRAETHRQMNPRIMCPSTPPLMRTLSVHASQTILSLESFLCGGFGLEQAQTEAGRVWGRMASQVQRRTIQWYAASPWSSRPIRPRPASTGAKRHVGGTRRPFIAPSPLAPSIIPPRATDTHLRIPRSHKRARHPPPRFVVISSSTSSTSRETPVSNARLVSDTLRFINHPCTLAAPPFDALPPRSLQPTRSVYSSSILHASHSPLHNDVSSPSSIPSPPLQDIHPVLPSSSSKRI